MLIQLWEILISGFLLLPAPPQCPTRNSLHDFYFYCFSNFTLPADFSPSPLLQLPTVFVSSAQMLEEETELPSRLVH